VNQELDSRISFSRPRTVPDDAVLAITHITLREFDLRAGD